MKKHCTAGLTQCASPCKCVPAAATSHRRAHHTTALRPHEAEVQRVRPGTDAAELEVLDCILISGNVVLIEGSKARLSVQKHFHPLFLQYDSLPCNCWLQHRLAALNSGGITNFVIFPPTWQVTKTYADLCNNIFIHTKQFINLKCTASGQTEKNACES